MWGCGLKRKFYRCRQNIRRSHPPCEGVDWNCCGVSSARQRSCHPPCEGVDWNISLLNAASLVVRVTLRVRVWIETHVVTCKRNMFESPSVWGCGLKRITRRSKRRRWVSHPPCEGVDWNRLESNQQTHQIRHPPCEGVDWNNVPNITKQTNLCHPPCEGVDWNVWQIASATGWSGHPPCEGVDWNR